MGTSAEIYYFNKGELQYIYNHYDGDVGTLGKTLFENYQTIGKVLQLLALGDVSYVGEEVESEDGRHSFDNPQEGVTVAYGRDRGEKHSDTSKKRLNTTDIEEVLTEVYEMSSEYVSYVYIHDKKTWYVINPKKAEFNAQLLSKSLGKEEPNSRVNLDNSVLKRAVVTKKKATDFARTLRTRDFTEFIIYIDKEDNNYFRYGIKPKGSEVDTTKKDVISIISWESYAETIAPRRPLQFDLAELISNKVNVTAHSLYKQGKLNVVDNRSRVIQPK